MVLIKNLKFFYLFIFGKIRKESVFDNILERKKKLFYTIKNNKLKSPKTGIFPKGLLYGFGQKFEKFPIFFIIDKISQQNMFDNILERKKAFLD